MNFFLATLAALSLFAAPTPYSEGEPDEARIVHILFDPPVDRPLRYLVETIRDREGTQSRNGSIVTVAFDAADYGYRTTFVHEEAPGMDFLPALPGMDRISELVRQPYSVRTSAAGEIVGLEDEAGLMERMSAAVELIAADADMPADAGIALRAYVQRFRDMPPAARLEFMMQDVAPIIGLGEVELVLGEAISVPIELPTPFGAIPVIAELRLENVVDGVALVISRTEVPDDEFRAIALNAIEQLAPAGQLEEIRRAIADEPMSMAISESYYLSVDRGTLVRYEREKVAFTGAGEGQSVSRDSMVIARLD